MTDIFSTVEHNKYKKYKNIIELGYGNSDQKEFVADYEAKGGTLNTPATGESTTTPEVTTPKATTYKPWELTESYGLRELTKEIGEGNIPEDVDEMLNQFRNPSVLFGFFGDPFGELSPEKQYKKLNKVQRKIQKKYGDDPNIKRILNYMESMKNKAQGGKQLSFLQGLGQWWREDAPKKLSDFNPFSSAMAGDLGGSGIPGIIERKWQAEKKLREDLGRDTSSQVPTYVDTAQVAAEPTGGGWQPDYAGAVADQQQQAAEAGQTHEQFMSDLDAVMAEGGMVEQRMNPLIKTSQLGIMGLQGYQGGQQPQHTGIIRQAPPQGGWPPLNIQDILGGGGPKGLWPPRGHPIQSPQHGFHQFGEQLGGFGETLGGYGEQLGGYEEQLGGFGETLGGYGEQIGGFGEQMSGVEEAMGGFGEQFKGLNNRLDSMEKGIASLSDQLQPKQPQFGGYGGYGGMGGYGGFGGGFGYRGRYG